MIRVQTPFSRAVGVIVSLTLVNATAPFGAYAAIGEPLRKHFERKAAEREREAAEPRVSTRPLSAKEQSRMQGRTLENPYLSGHSKWDVVYKGVNVMTGNYGMSVTDLSFEGGYGIPVNVTRTYSANNPDEGPFGKGWTLSADLRNTAGGLLKSGSAPVRSIPTSFKQRHSLQLDDPNTATDPVEAVVTTDAGGKETTIQQDVDGLFTVPPWDKNINEPEHEWVSFGGADYRITKYNKLITPEGTTYIYEKRGSYVGGIKPWNDSSKPPEPANVLKVTTVTDRNGNVTTYSYDTSSTVSFVKANGTASENKLTSVQMPNGRTITFTWTGARVTSVSDSVRTVTYGYTGGKLTSVTTPAGKQTTYGYGSAMPTEWGEEPATDLLTTITDPRGLTTTIHYAMYAGFIAPYLGGQPGPVVDRIDHPNGTKTHFNYSLVIDPFTQSPYSSMDNIVIGEHHTLPHASWNALVREEGYQGVGIPMQMHFNVWVGEPNGLVVVYGGFPETEPDPNASFPLLNNVEWAKKWIKYYDRSSQNLVEDQQNVSVASDSLVTTWRRMITPFPKNSPRLTGRVRTVNKYNVFGSPLEQTVHEEEVINNVFTIQRTATVKHAYWGKEKFYQKKATLDPAGRYSFTDYFDKNAATGKKGQTYRVYDEKRADFFEDASIPVPPNTPTSNYWRYRIRPTDWNAHSAEFDYDSKGRPTKVLKIQRTDTVPWTYVRTDTQYGADTSPTWGMATMVTEDVGGINRITQTLEYDSIGRARRVVDPNGREFTTDYDDDGRVLQVRRTDGGLNQPVVTYAYGSSGITNGQVTGVTDGLSGVVQTFGYGSTGTATGQVTGVTEVNGADSYSVAYQYNNAAERMIAAYFTPAGTVKWEYRDYLALGAPESPARAFQTLTMLDANNQRTSEEFHYEYNTNGALLRAAFAQSPQLGQTTYSGSNPAATRARAFYDYDPAGRLRNLEHYWDVWNSSTNNYNDGQPILGNHCDYELTGLNRGLKTRSQFYAKNPTSNQWVMEWEETFGYDPQLDYLTSANYGDGQANPNQAWTYDAAGNRISDTSNPGSWSYDNLNRISASPGFTYTHDLAGNRLTKGGSITYGWDVLNRMTSYTSAGVTTNYVYRADGMRVSKTTGVATTRYRYDGQMGIEDADSATATKFALGARGIDRLDKAGVVSYPIYDGHGNMIATLAKAATTFNISNRRSFDAWGQIRQGLPAGDPQGRYCATLGHKQDDESGLLYVSARYCDTTMGRFLSEDRVKDGYNWYVYCGGNPVSRSDASGETWADAELAAQLWLRALRASHTLRLVAFRFLQLFEVAHTIGQAMPLHAYQRYERNQLMAMLTTVTISGGLGGTPTSPVQNIVGFFAGYTVAIGILIYMLGIDEIIYAN